MTITRYEAVADGADRAAAAAADRAVEARRMLAEAEQKLTRARTDAAFARAEGDARAEKEARDTMRRLEKEIGELRAAVAADDEESRVQGVVAVEARQRLTIERRKQAEAMRPAYLEQQREIIQMADRLLAALRRQQLRRGQMQDLGVNPESIVGGQLGGSLLQNRLEMIIEEAGKGYIDGVGLNFQLRNSGWVLKGGECERDG